MSLLDTFLATATRCADKTAVIDGAGRSISFAELADWSAVLASTWRAAGIGKGDRVLLAVPLGLGLYASLAALWRLGAVAVFPEPALGLAGLRHAARATRPNAYLSDGWLRALAYIVPELWPIRTRLVPTRFKQRSSPLKDRIVEKLEGTDAALISFTSGSTGLPKAIERTHGFLLAQHRAVSPLLATDRADEIDLVSFPVFVLVNLALGITSVLPCWKVTRPDHADMAQLADFAHKNHITRLLAPPSICERMVDTPAASAFNAIFTGGGPVYPDLLQRLSAAKSGLRIAAVYGSTEAEPIAHVEAAGITPADWACMRTGGGLLAGKPSPHVRLRLLDDEIVVTGDHVNKSYMDTARNASSKLTLEGEVWHRTGDAGRLDDEGRLWLLGRLAGRAGSHYPFGIEAAARFWPGVRRCALIGTANGSVLAIEGNAAHRSAWTTAATALGDIRIAVLKTIPLDRRHRSKVDYQALATAVTRSKIVD